MQNEQRVFTAFFPLLMLGISLALCPSLSLAAPTVGPPVVSPSPIPVGQPTVLTITSTITAVPPDPAVIPTSVNVLRLDATGKVMATLGTMRDDGTNGDAVAGDGIFTLRVTVTEPAAGQIRLQTSAAFRTLLRRVLSPIATVPVQASSAILAVSPARLRVNALGTTAQVHVFFEQNGARTEVTTAPGTTYVSSNPGVVSVDTVGLLTFRSAGSATVTASFGGLSAGVQIEINTNAMLLIEGEIGLQGGALMLPNGTGVHIPPGALVHPEMIRIEEVPLPGGMIIPDNGSLVSPLYNFTPDGLTFNTEIEVAIGYDPTDIPPGYTEESILVHLLYPNGRLDIESLSGPLGEEDLVESHNQALDVGQHVATVRTFHFSDRALIVGLGLAETTLVAPDGTELRVFQNLKQERADAGPDKLYGSPHFDDNGDDQEDECAEFEMTGDPAHPHDDKSVPLDTRNEAAITHIVLHSTAGGTGHTFSGEVRYAASRRSCYWAHYYVGKDGTIVQISKDNVLALHVRPNNSPNTAGFGINNANTIGIEIFNNCAPGNQNSCTPDEPYPGRQLSAVVRLIDFLLRVHPNITRPPTNLVPFGSGNLITHADQDATPGRKHDPTGNFRSRVMAPPSLEDIIYQALRQDHGGLIEAKGGDSLGGGGSSFRGGDGGTVELMAGVIALENDVNNTRPSLIVPANQPPMTFSGATNLMHLIVAGTLRFASDTTLDIDGIFYVAPGGVIDTRGLPDGGRGYSLTIQADGFALIEGKIFTSGANKLDVTESGTGAGYGGSAGWLSFQTAAPGPIWVPTIITRGGDTDESNPADLAATRAGRGGDVEIIASVNNANDRIPMYFQGSPTFDFDTLPSPPPFNQMVSCVIRPTAGQRLALDNTIFTRGILTIGGIGGGHNDRTVRSGPGGHSGHITIRNDTSGRVFFNAVDLFAGAGVESLCYQIFIASFGDFGFYEAPSGGLGGKGTLNGGNGGNGGDGGAITIIGTLSPPLSTFEVDQVVTGHNGGNPVFSFGIPIGKILRFKAANRSLLFRTNSTGGSGGVPGGAALQFPGFFGNKATDGTTIIDGTQFFP